MTTMPFTQIKSTANTYDSAAPSLKEILKDLPEVAGMDDHFQGSVFTEITSENDRLKNEMKRRGFEEAKLHRAEPTGLEACLKTLFEAFKHANTEKWQAGEKERLTTQGQIREWQARNEELQKKKGRLQENERRKQAAMSERIASLKQAVRHIMDEQLSVPPADTLLKSFVGFIFFFLTLSLFVFYVNAAYRAFFPVHRYSGDTSELERILQDSGIFDTTVFLSGIYAMYPVFVPFLFIGFGVGLHLLMDNIVYAFKKTYTKTMAILLLMLLTLLFDGLIALRIHHNIHFMKELMGQEPVAWYVSEDFWLVIFCGFISCLLWSLLFHGLQALRHSADPACIRQHKMAAYRQELASAETGLAASEQKLSAELELMEEEISQNRLKIVQLESSLHEDKLSVTYNGKLKLCLDAYFAGWLQYVNALNDSPALLQQVFSQFIASHFTQATA